MHVIPGQTWVTGHISSLSKVAGLKMAPRQTHAGKHGQHWKVNICNVTGAVTSQGEPHDGGNITGQHPPGNNLHLGDNVGGQKETLKGRDQLPTHGAGAHGE